MRNELDRLIPTGILHLYLYSEDEGELQHFAITCTGEPVNPDDLPETIDLHFETFTAHVPRDRVVRAEWEPLAADSPPGVAPSE